MATNKVNFGISNVYYAVLTEGSTNSWATPVHVPGAVSITLDDNSASNPFYADNVTYYRSFTNAGYSGTLEMAKISEAMYSDIWGMSEHSTDKVIYEKTGVQPKPFALLFAKSGDTQEDFYCLYRVMPTSKPTEGTSTIEDSATPVTQSFDFEAAPLVTGTTNQIGLISVRTASDTTTSSRNAWFSAVKVPSA